MSITNQYKLPNSNFIKAGESSFQARIPFYSNPYKSNPHKSLWIRGWKKAEQDFFAMCAKSKAFMETLPLEEVED